ncbi:MAG: arginine--tRNA ligase [Lachnospiraceae bacterium]|nr:arginine--tRNA ligase [Lachnospiraceae bacterium]
MKKEIGQYVAEFIGECSPEQVSDLIEIPPDSKMGDYAIPCFPFAKLLHKSPAVIAEEIKQLLSAKQEELSIQKMEQVGGYCNIYLNRGVYVQNCLEQLQLEDFAIEKIGVGKTICMDYSSPNIAKNFHVGHLRTTIIGNSIYKIYDKLGYQVVRINHLGDWGTQFGKLIVAYKKWSSRERVEEKGIDELLAIYIKFNAEAENHPELIDEARAWFVKMEQDDKEALEIWNWFKEISMVEFERVYRMLDISFDSYLGESFYRSRVPALVEKLKKKNLLTESQGANIVDLSAYDMPPCLITKKDGGSIYHSRDIAAILYRKEQYDFEKCLYVTGLEQSLHFKQVFKTIELMGYKWYDGLVHIPYGLVSLDGAKLSTRNGNIIYAEDILNEAVKRAAELIHEKNPTLSNQEEVAQKVGVGAVIFHDLFHQRMKNVDFKWKDVLSFDGTTGPYVQYTYARAKSILRKSQFITDRNDMGQVDYETLTDGITFGLIKTLSGYSDAVMRAAEQYEPSVIARYIISVAAAFNQFYQECPILRQEKENVRNARLFVVDMVQRILKDACGLLGVKCPEEM